MSKHYQWGKGYCALFRIILKNYTAKSKEAVKPEIINLIFSQPLSFLTFSIEVSLSYSTFIIRYPIPICVWIY